MLYHVVIKCLNTDKEVKRYIGDFLPRIGDTVFDDNGIHMKIIEVVYNIPDDNQKCLTAAVLAAWR